MKLKSTAGFIVISTATMAGCTTPPVKTSSPSAWNAYQAFQLELTKDPKSPDFEQYLSGDWINKFNSAENEDTLAELRQYAAYPGWLAETQAHYEKPKDNDHCLSVNGTALDGSPGTLAVRYVRESGGLKASDIHYQYWESEEEFPAEARCPEDFELGFPGA